MDNQKYFAPSVDMAAKILNFLSRYDTKKSTLTEISNALDINKSTCSRILKTLELNNFVYCDPESQRYSLGINMAVLGSRAYETLDYLAYIKNYLAEATEKTGLTSGLMQRISQNRMMVVSQHVASKHPSITMSIGNKFPLTDVSYGKWILAYGGEEEREAFLSKGLRQVTEYTVTDPLLYRKQLEEIRESGVLVSKEEYTPGLTAISSPIFNRNQTVLGVIAILGISSTLKETDIAAYANILKEISIRCSAQFKDIVIEYKPPEI